MTTNPVGAGMRGLGVGVGAPGVGAGADGSGVGEADGVVTGKATFGFVSTYQKGAKTPTGETEFQFKVTDLNFRSTTFFY